MDESFGSMQDLLVERVHLLGPEIRPEVVQQPEVGLDKRRERTIKYTTSGSESGGMCPPEAAPSQGKHRRDELRPLFALKVSLVFAFRRQVVDIFTNTKPSEQDRGRQAKPHAASPLGHADTPPSIVRATRTQPAPELVIHNCAAPAYGEIGGIAVHDPLPLAFEWGVVDWGGHVSDVAEDG
ncbi:hypothetical protein C8R44DRAFT_742237 [Mycena epipterygia]|nr:hypothetical protein C8R44DRAFT_742237 [Mycena epipterygia]